MLHRSAIRCFAHFQPGIYNSGFDITVERKRGSLNMRVYHSSVLKVEKPLISYSRDFLDFGKVFYVTTILSQAEKYAERFKFREKDAWLNIFEFDYDVHNGM